MDRKSREGIATKCAAGKCGWWWGLDTRRNPWFE